MEKLFILVPCYNEEEVLPETIKRLGGKLRSLIRGEKISPDSRVVFIDDGSEDSTWQIIKDASLSDCIFAGLSLDRNRGHQTALTEGLMAARDKRAVSVSIDADLQDDVDAIDEMLARHENGAHIVCGVRGSRKTDSIPKRVTARGYYALMKLFGSPLIYDHADFRLMDPEALDALSFYHGDDLFLRGLITRLGFRCEKVIYDRAARFAGESKYTLRKMLRLAARGAVSGRMKPAESPRKPYEHTREAVGFE